jgi:tetratricopeptide (TPR) repeat protein
MNNINYDIIDLYLSGKVDDEAKKQFEKELEENEELANEVKLYKNIDNEMSNYFQNSDDENLLRKNLTDLNNTHFFELKKSKIIKFNKWWLAAAAAAILILVLILNPFSNSNKINNKTIYAQFTSKVDALPSADRGSNLDSLIYDATAFYNQKKYSEALPLLIKAIDYKKNDTELQLATGICFLKTEKFEQAINIFNKIANSESVFKDKANFYKALIYLNQNKLDEANSTLQLISTTADEQESVVKLKEFIETQKK